MEDFRVRMSFSAGRREAGQAATKAQAILGLVCAGFVASLAGSPASAQLLDRAAWVQAPPERHAEVLVAVVSHLLTEGAEILQGRCPLGPLSPDCDATPAPSGGQALLAEAGQGTIVLAADPNRHLGGAQFDDLDEREPDAIAAAVARLNETVGPRFTAGEYHPVRDHGVPGGFRLTSPEGDGLLADCTRWRCIMEPGVTAVILFSYPGIIVTELSSPFAELQLRIQGDIRRLGPERHIHAGQFRVVPEEGGWRAAWEGPMRYIQFREPGGGPAR